MRILVIGDWHSEVHEEWVFQAFRVLGHEVFPLSGIATSEPRRSLTGPAGQLERFVLKLQNRLILGPRVAALNRDAVRAVDRFRPDMVFVYRGTHLLPKTLRMIKASNPAMVLVGHNNDNPFVSGQVYGLWRHFLGRPLL